MDISLDLYKSFYYVCKFKSITQAGNVLYLSQPAVSKQLKKLEEGIGKVLFIMCAERKNSACSDILKVLRPINNNYY